MVQLIDDKRMMTINKAVLEFETAAKHIRDEYEKKMREILNNIKTREVNRLKNELGMHNSENK